MKQALAALACLFLAAHIASLPDSLEDIDSVNFALAVRDFDVARHQPHPPGYPVYVAISKASAAMLGGADESRTIVTALAAWSAIAGAALVALLFTLFRGFGGDQRRAWWAMGITVSSPLFWFTALRPLSDMSGLAAAVASQALIVPVLSEQTGRRPGRLLVAGAFIAGLAAGIRMQTAMLTAPLLAAAILLPRAAVTPRMRLAAVASAFSGVIVWLIPLIAASGGVEGYLAALGTQAGEDFSGVAMLWTTRTSRVAVDAFMYSFLWPWGTLVLGATVFAAAAIGAARLLAHDPRTAVWLALAFGPYAIFHLLFHETVTIRYALPLLAPVAFLTASSIDWAGPRAATLLSAALIVMLLIVGVRAAHAYGAAAAPPFQAMRDVREDGGGWPVGMHAVFRRTAEWSPPGGTVLRAPHGQEWLALVERWKTDPRTPIHFVSDPRRTDLALFDPHARELKGSYRWPFPPLPYVAGVRPGNTDRYSMQPPGWMLDRGWALSAELGGIAARDAAGPHLQPSIAWVLARRAASLLMVGGRNLHPTASSQLTLLEGSGVIDRWEAGPGFFFRSIPIAAGALEGQGYVPLSVHASTSGKDPVPVSLEQFDLQPDGVKMVGFKSGWQEPEYSPTTARGWRWMTERAVLWVRPIGQDAILTLSGESPLKYFDSAPTVRVSAGGEELMRFAPSADFTREVRVPALLLERAAGDVLIESDRWFVPAEREGSLDRRHLALRIYQVSVR